MVVQNVKISKLNTSIVKPCRLALREEAIEKYDEVLRNNNCEWVFPPLLATTVGGVTYLLDGQHRLISAEHLGLQVVPVSMIECKDTNEAKRVALSANCKHGEKLTREEMRANIKAYLSNGGAIESDTQIAQVFGVSRNLVADIRKSGGGTKKERADKAVAKALEDNPNASVNAISKETGLSRSAVNARIKAMPKDDEGKPQPKILHDCYKREIPQDHIHRYERLQEAVKVGFTTIKQFKKCVKELNDLHFFPHTQDVESIQSYIDCLNNILKFRNPEALCTCRGDGCHICGGVGFLSKKAFEVKVPESEQ